jgi:hypothetical protein
MTRTTSTRTASSHRSSPTCSPGARSGATRNARCWLWRSASSSRCLQFAGTLDRLLRIEGARWLVDLKTCFTTPITAGPQTAAYLRALGDTSVTRRAALRLRPDGTYRFDALTGVDDWSAFMACLTLHRFKESHAS